MWSNDSGFANEIRNICVKCKIGDNKSKIKCRNCQKVFHLECAPVSLYNFSPSDWSLHQWFCEACAKNNLGFVSGISGQPPFMNVQGMCMKQVVDMLRTVCLESFSQKESIEEIKNLLRDQKSAYDANTLAIIQLQATQLDMIRQSIKLEASMNQLCGLLQNSNGKQLSKNTAIEKEEKGDSYSARCSKIMQEETYSAFGIEVRAEEYSTGGKGDSSTSEALDIDSSV